MILDLINGAGGRKFILSFLSIAAITLLAALGQLTLEVMGAITAVATGFNVTSSIEDSAKAKASGAVVVAAAENTVSPEKITQLTAASQPKAPPA